MSCHKKSKGEGENINTDTNKCNVRSYSSLDALAEVATHTNYMAEDVTEKMINSPFQPTRIISTHLNNIPYSNKCLKNVIKKSNTACYDQKMKSEEVHSDNKNSNNSTSCSTFCNDSYIEINDKRKKSFPETLMDILSSKDIGDMITWLPRGNAFVILDKANLTKHVLPLYFKQIQYRSFVTRLYRWGFKRSIKGEGDCKVFYHKFFLRDSTSLCKMIYIHADIKKTAKTFTSNEQSNVKYSQNPRNIISLSELLGKKLEGNDDHKHDLQRSDDTHNLLTTNFGNVMSLNNRNSCPYANNLLQVYFDRKMNQIRSFYYPITSFTFSSNNNSQA